MSCPGKQLPSPLAPCPQPLLQAPWFRQQQGLHQRQEEARLQPLLVLVRRCDLLTAGQWQGSTGLWHEAGIKR